MGRLAILLVVVAALLTAPAALAGAHDQLPLHTGSSGARVAGLQWMDSGPHGHRPNVFTVAGTFHGKPNGLYGARTAAAVYALKYRLGYPARFNSKKHPIAGAYLFKILRGTAHRPAQWVANAAGRVRAIEASTPTAWAIKAKAYELRLLALDIREQPDGSNRGPRISFSFGGTPALQSATGAYGLAWCVSTQQTVFKEIGYGTFAAATAGVYAAVDYYAARNLVFAKPKFASLVAFIDYDRYGHRIPGTGHMGFVVKVEANSFTYTAGNDGNAFREHTIPFGSRSYLFIRLRGVAT